MITEGRRVKYAGDDPFQDVGSFGRVVALSGMAAHIMWENGPKSGSLELTDLNDLIEVEAGQLAASGTPLSTSAQYDLSLDMMNPGIEVRATLEEGGVEGLLNTLSESGHLAVLAVYADEAIGMLAARIRQDPGLIDVLSQLSPEEETSLVAKVASSMLAESMGDE